jgi:transposase
MRGTAMDPLARIDALESQVRDLLAVVAAKDATIAAKDATIADLIAKLQAMEVRLSAMQRRIFGRSSEQLHDPGQQTLDLLGSGLVPFGSAAATAEATAADRVSATVIPAARRPRGKRLGRLPDHIELVERVLDVPEAERVGRDGLPLVRLTEEVVERLDYVPSHYRRLRIIRPVYGRAFTDADVQPRVVAPAPTFLVPRGLPTDALAIQVVIAKYADHLPLYRQSAIAARQGVHLPRSTLCDWVATVAGRLKPVWEAIGDEVRAGEYLHLDDTPIRVLAKDRCLIGRLWTYGVPDAVHVRYAPSRAGCWPHDFLRGYRGYVVGDAYAGHNALFTDGDRTPVACWVHARRNFNDLIAQEPAALTMVCRIAVLYGIEKRLRDAHADRDTIRAARQREAIPQLAVIRTELDRLTIATTPKSPLGKATNYALPCWNALIRYADTGFLPLDNNLAERSIRPVAIGRKNYLFLGSGEDGGGDWAAIAYSLIGSCALNHLDPYRYLTEIAPHLVDWRFADYASLTPRAWAKRTAQAAA